MQTEASLNKQNVVLFNDDAYNVITFLKNNKLTFNHIITDPPYKISKQNNINTMAGFRQGLDFGQWDKQFDLYSWIDKYSQLIDQNGSFIIFCSYRFVSYIIDRLERNNFIVKDLIKWIKKNPMPRNIERRYVQDTEFAIWAVNKKSHWTFNKDRDVKYLRAEFHTPIVSGKEKTIHPTQKSIDLMQQIIKIHTNLNDSILDPFMGSGTTGIASLQLKRRFVGIELNSDYYHIAKKRILHQLRMNNNNRLLESWKEIIINEWL